MAELWAAITGLELVWFLGLRRLIFESDSMVTVNLITRHNVKVDANYAPVVRAKEILVREWEVKVQYTFREANVAAVWLDKKSF